VRKTDSSSVSDGNKDGAAYSALLRNELLGANIDSNMPYNMDSTRMINMSTPSLYSVSRG